MLPFAAEQSFFYSVRTKDLSPTKSFANASYVTLYFAFKPRKKAMFPFANEQLYLLKGLSHEIDFKNVDKNLQN
jgi:hypothetical protein